MKLVKTFLFVVMLIGTLVLTGCSNVVYPVVSRSEFINDKDKIASIVVLHTTNAFRGYECKHVDWWFDGTAYDMKIGSLATEWFRYSLESQFEKVEVNSEFPKFPYPKSNVDFVIVPEFTSFKAGGPVVIPFENYWVKLGMKTTIYDKSGNVLDVVELNEKGSKRGVLWFNQGTEVYPEVCRRAVSPLVEKSVQRLIEVSNQ